MAWKYFPWAYGHEIYGGDDTSSDDEECFAFIIFPLYGGEYDGCYGHFDHSANDGGDNPWRYFGCFLLVCDAVGVWDDGHKS